MAHCSFINRAVFRRHLSLVIHIKRKKARDRDYTHAHPESIRAKSLSRLDKKKIADAAAKENCFSESKEESETRLASV